LGKVETAAKTARVRVGVSMIFEINIKKSITASILISTSSNAYRDWKKIAYSMVKEAGRPFPRYLPS
jgi:hypothetical protein